MTEEVLENLITKTVKSVKRETHCGWEGLRFEFTDDTSVLVFAKCRCDYYRPEVIIEEEN